MIKELILSIIISLLILFIDICLISDNLTYRNLSYWLFILARNCRIRLLYMFTILVAYLLLTFLNIVLSRF